MKNCTHCKHADWQRTAAGKLHPAGDGMCKFPVAIPPLPACMHWMAMPRLFGGAINRQKELSTHCVYYARKEQ